jgi:hypothetical protein
MFKKCISDDHASHASIIRLLLMQPLVAGNKPVLTVAWFFALSSVWLKGIACRINETLPLIASS